jgi:hypothetical protein
MDRGSRQMNIDPGVTVGVGLHFWAEYGHDKVCQTKLPLCLAVGQILMQSQLSAQRPQPTRSLLVVLCIPRHKYRLLRGEMCSH